MIDWGGLIRVRCGGGSRYCCGSVRVGGLTVGSFIRGGVGARLRGGNFGRGVFGWSRGSSSSCGIRIAEKVGEVKKADFKPLYKKYLALSKARLSSLVVVSALFGYFFAPGNADFYEVICVTLGTSLTAASANSINQYIEIDNDLKMERTKNRILPSKALSLNHALAFGVLAGTIGVTILVVGTNFFTALLGFFNILAYTLIYTPLKKLHHSNTYVGSVVGAIPPLMGWVAQTNSFQPYSLLIPAVLFLWQLPHFYSLSWPLRHDYDRAGYKMLSNIHPEKLPLNTLFWTLSLFLIAPLIAYSGFTSWWLVLDSSIPTLYWALSSYNFYCDPSNSNALSSFKISLYWLPVFLLLVALHLKPENVQTPDSVP